MAVKYPPMITLNPQSRKEYETVSNILTEAPRSSDSSGEINRLTRGAAMPRDMRKAAIEKTVPNVKAYFSSL